MSKILLLISCFFVVSSAIAQDTFSGRWNNYDPNDELKDYFSITLVQDSTKITGSHFATVDQGRFIDECGDDSMNGEIINGVAIVKIKSGRLAKIAGTAKIEHIGKDSVLFTLIKEPSGGEHMIPKNIILTKAKTYKQPH